MQELGRERDQQPPSELCRGRVETLEADVAAAALAVGDAEALALVHEAAQHLAFGAQHLGAHGQLHVALVGAAPGRRPQPRKWRSW